MNEPRTGEYGTYCPKCGNEGPPCACPGNPVPVEPAPAPDPLASALEKLRACAATGEETVAVKIYADQCAALLAKLEAADLADRHWARIGELTEALATVTEQRDAALAAAQQRIAELEKREAGLVYHRDLQWIQAMAEALGSDSGYPVPILPDVLSFKKLFAALANPPQDRKERS